MGAALPILSIASTALGAGMTAVGQIQQGRAAAAQANYQSQVANNNRILAMRAADDALHRGKIAETQQRFKTRQLIGLQRASLASNGVLVDTGTALGLTVDTAGIGELDALTVRDNAAREADRFRQQGANFAAESELLALKAKSSSGLGAAFGTLLTGAGSVAGKWYDYNNEGIDVWPWGGTSYPSGGK